MNSNRIYNPVEINVEFLNFFFQNITTYISPNIDRVCTN